MQNDYLTEKSLQIFVLERFCNYIPIFNKTVPNSGTAHRPDVRLEELKLIIEFDGDRHFTSSSIILTEDIFDFENWEDARREVHRLETDQESCPPNDDENYCSWYIDND